MEYKDIIQELIKFRNDREWNQYHTLISLSRALNIEASEVEKIFLWKKMITIYHQEIKKIWS